MGGLSYFLSEDDSFMLRKLDSPISFFCLDRLDICYISSIFLKISWNENGQFCSVFKTTSVGCQPPLQLQKWF